jgi:alpha-L-arabinofuranosidase
MNAVPFALTAAALSLGITAGIAAQPQRLTVTVDTAKTEAPISKYLYGGFIEHIGPLIYRSLWAELLDDRKFYFPISSKDSETAARPQGGPGRMPLHKWRPVGADQVVSMDRDVAFVGEQSPCIELEASTPHGIRQSGFALVKGKKYTGRVYLRGTAGSSVQISLIWGAGANDRQTIPFTALSDTYKKYPLSFTADADTRDAALEITGTGTGNFHIGTVSLMPADNVQGFRPDTIALIRELHAGMWRLPGGNFLSDTPCLRRR